MVTYQFVVASIENGVEQEARFWRRLIQSFGRRSGLVTAGCGRSRG